VRRPSCSKCGATWVDDQIGQEETPEQYVARLVEVFREVRRVLRDDGTLWLNLGDTHNNRARMRKSSHQPSLHAFAEATWKDTAAKGGCRSSINSGGIKEKDLLLIPAIVAMALRADGWYLRSDIIWHKASHLPKSVRDRPTACHEHVFVLSKSKTYYYDSESIAEDCASSSEFSDTKNARDVWVIAPKAYTLAHFAVMPLDLAGRCVKAGSSSRGCCSACGAPWLRQMKGWAPSCKCKNDNPTPCKLLDPFAGAGTTGLAALRHGRDAVLIELNSEYCKLMDQRLAGEVIGTFD
jgi:site-specific DNA-methyltransferase (cytosine-N4-specific)